MKCCGSARQATIALGVQRLPGLLPVREPQAEREALALCGSAQAGRRDFFAKNRRELFAKAHRDFFAKCDREFRCEFLREFSVNFS